MSRFGDPADPLYVQQNGAAAPAAPADSAPAAGAAAPVDAKQSIFDGTVWNRQREASIGSGGVSKVGYPGVAMMTSDASSFIRPLVNAAGLTDGSALSAALAAVGYGISGSNIIDRLRLTKTFKVINAVAIGSETTIWTPTSGKKFRLMGLALASTTGGAVLLRDNTAGTIIAIVPILTANTPLRIDFGNGILSAAANNLLTATGAGNLSGTVWGVEE